VPPVAERLKTRKNHNGGPAVADEGRSFERFFQYSILGMVASGYLAVAASGTLDTPTMVVAAAAIVARTLLVSRIIDFRIPDWIANVAAIAYIGFYPIDYQFISEGFLPATVHLVFFLAAMLLVKAGTRRDYFFLKLIAFVEVLAASIVSSDIRYLAFLGAFLVCGAAALMSGEIRSHLDSRKGRSVLSGLPVRLGWLTLFVFLSSTVVASGLFTILPRTAHAALRHLVPERFHLPGFSNEVRLGQIGEIQQTRIPVMHVRFYDPDLPVRIQDHLKWRGSALAQFDGKRWYNVSETGRRINVDNGEVRLPGLEQPLPVSSRRLAYTVQLKNITGDTLFLTGVPESLHMDALQVIRTPTNSYRMGAGWIPGMRYTAYSRVVEEPSIQSAEPLPESSRLQYLMLPPQDVRVIDLSRRLTQPVSTPLEKARAVERYLRTSFPYTLEMPEKTADDPVAHFLFERKKGHCEYFASAMAVMLRAVRIPSRVATGFQSGVYNPVSGWRLIRTSDAHSWVEAYLDGYGWVTFDPTPSAVVPEHPGLLTRMGMYLDAAEIFWHDWIVAYDLERQVTLANRVGQSGRNLSLDWMRRWENWKPALDPAAPLKSPRLWMALVGTALWIVAAIIWGPRFLFWVKSHRRVRRLRRGHAESSDATLLYERMLALLFRRGWAKPGSTTPIEFARLLPESAHGGLVRDFTSAYYELRFGGKVQAASRMIALLEQLEGQGRPLG